MRTKNAARITPAERDHLARVKECAADGCGRAVIARGMCHTHYMRERRSGRINTRPKTDQDFIAARIAISERGCWEWQSTKREGYGVVSGRGRRQAHALSYEAHVGPIPEGRQVNHLCHNRACVNPAHLYIGTQKQNVDDMLRAGRNRPVRGVASPACKITAADALAIRASTGNARLVGERYGVSASLVYAIRKGACWRHLK